MAAVSPHRISAAPARAVRAEAPRTETDHFSASGERLSPLRRFSIGLGMLAALCTPAVAQTAVAEPHTSQLHSVEDVAHKVEQKAEPVFAAHPRQWHGYTLTFRPVAVDADLFARGPLSIETRTGLAQTAIRRTDTLGGWNLTHGIQGDFLVRHTFGGDPSRNSGVFPANSLGPRFELTETARHGLTKGSVNPDDTRMLGNVLKGPMRFISDNHQGVEFHPWGNGTQPYYRGLTGIEKEIPLHFRGKMRTITVKAGPQLEGTLARAVSVSPGAGVDLRW